MSKVDTKNSLPDLYRPFIIYRHTCKITGEVYIGQTCQDPKVRWGNEGKGYKQCPLFYKAIIKYKWVNFIHEILYYDLTSEEADEKEIKLIAHYKSLGISYNIASGGSGYPSDVLNKPVLQIDRKTGKIIREYSSITEAAKEIGISNSSISECCLCKRKSAGGYYWKFRDDRSYDVAAWEEIHNPLLKVVLQIDRKTGEIIKEFSSISEASRETGVSVSNISECCLCKRKSAGGYYWKFRDDRSYDVAVWEEIHNKPNKPGPPLKTILQIDPKTGEIIREFPSVTEAFRVTGISISSISACCRGKQKTAGGYYWKFRDDRSYDADCEEIRNKLNPLSKAVLQIDLETGKIIREYPSAVEAYKVTGVGISDISACCRGKQLTAGGYGWRFAD